MRLSTRVPETPEQLRCPAEPRYDTFMLQTTAQTPRMPRLG